MTLYTAEQVSEARVRGNRSGLRPSFAALRGTIAGIFAKFGSAASETARTRRSALLTFAIRVLSAGLLYLSQIAMARWMGTFDYGIYVFVWTWVMILGGLAHGGLNVAMIRLIPQHREHGEFDLVRGLLRYGRLFAFASSTMIAVLAALTLWAFQDLLSSYYVLPLFIALVCVPMFTLSDIQDGIGRANAWMLAGLVPPYVLRPLLLLITMAIAHGFGVQTTAVTAAAAAILATWLSALVQFAAIQREVARTFPVGPRRVDLALWTRTALPLLVIGGCEMLLQNTDVLIVSAYLSPSDVAIYFAAAKTMALIMFVHYAVGSASANRFAAHSARGDHDALARDVRDAVHLTFWPSLLLGGIILLCGEFLLSLFGPEFVAGYPVMMILVVGFLARSAMGPSEFLLNMAGQQVACASIFAASAVLNIVLNVLLVPVYGLPGAAISTATAITFAAAANCAVARYKLGLAIGIWSHVGRG